MPFTVRIPERMPSTLQARDETRRQPIQIGEAVRASALAVAEDAVAHLAGGRPLPAPASLEIAAALGPSANTWHTRIATPLVPYVARVHGVLVADGPDVVEVEAGLSGGSWTNPGPITVGAASAGLPVEFDFDIPIIAGGGETVAPGYIDVDFRASHSGASNVDLHSWGVIVLPHYAPWADPEVEIYIEPPNYYLDSVVPVGGVVSHWTTRSGGTLQDETGTWPATLAGGYSSGAELLYGGGTSVDYDGATGTHAAVADLSAFAHIHNTMIFSVECWFSWGGDGSNSLDMLVGNTATSAHKGFFFGVDDRGGSGYANALRVQIFRGVGGTLVDLLANNAIVAGQTHHAVVTCDAVTARLYLDGVEVDSAAAIATNTGNATNAMRIGGCGGFDFPFNGELDAVTIRNTCPDAADVAALYAGGLF